VSGAFHGSLVVLPAELNTEDEGGRAADGRVVAVDGTEVGAAEEGGWMDRAGAELAGVSGMALLAKEVAVCGVGIAILREVGR